MSIELHQKHMRYALNLAKRGCFTVSPNPMVGCVIVKNHQIIGEGYHQHAGGPHAEIIALQAAGVDAKNADVYVTLEPCCHWGKTSPCTKALIAAGVKQVYAASIDPNINVNGKGIQELRANGILVQVGICEADARTLNEFFFHYIKYKRPFVISKWAMSLDGKTITNPGDTRNISSDESLQASHQLRQQVDAILVGATTVVHDNPLLTVRFGDAKIHKHPFRIILASRGNLPLSLNIFDRKMPSKTIVVTTNKADLHWRKTATAKGAEILMITQDVDGFVNLRHLLDELGNREITSVLVEGGMKTHESFFREGLINKIHVDLALVIIGDFKTKKLISDISCKKNERDYRFTASLKGLENV